MTLRSLRLVALLLVVGATACVPRNRHDGTVPESVQDGAALEGDAGLADLGQPPGDQGASELDGGAVANDLGRPDLGQPPADRGLFEADGSDPAACCAVERGDLTACEGSACAAIRFDRVIECDDSDSGERGHAVASLGRTSHVAGFLGGDLRLYAIDEDDARCLDDFPMAAISRPVALAVGAGDTLYALADETHGRRGDEMGGLTMVTYAGGSFSREVLAEVEREAPFYGLVVDRAGLPHVWHQSDRDERSHAYLDGASQWHTEVVDPPRGSWDDWDALSLTNRERTVAFWWSRRGRPAWQMQVRVGDETRDFGPLRERGGRERHRPIPPAPGGEEPAYGAVVDLNDRLQVVWASEAAEGWSVADLPRSGWPVIECDPDPSQDAPEDPPPCQPPCVEKGTGLTQDAFAVTRTRTHAYVAYVLTHLERDLIFAVAQTGDDEFDCIGQPVEDRTTVELVVARVAFADGSVEELLALPMAQTLGARGSNADSVAISAASDCEDCRLSVSIRTVGANRSRIRVLNMSVR